MVPRLFYITLLVDCMEERERLLLDLRHHAADGNGWSEHRGRTEVQGLAKALYCLSSESSPAASSVG